MQPRYIKPPASSKFPDDDTLLTPTSHSVMATYDSPTGELTVGEPQTSVLSKIETRFCKEW